MPRKSRSSLSPPLSQIAYQQIKEQIITLELRPGEQVDENALADRLAIGRTPIREALFRLVAEELVQVVHGRGFFVRDVTLQDLKDLFEALLILERAAVALAAKRITPEQIQHLKKINADLAKAWQSKDYLQVTLLNSRFHRTLYQAADNVFLNSYLNTLQSQSQRLAYICFSKETAKFDLESHGALAIRDHNKLIALLTEGDGAAAVNLNTDHLKLFQERVNNFINPALDDLHLMD